MLTGLRVDWSGNRGSISRMCRDSSLLHCVRSSNAAHTAVSPRVKRSEHDDLHLVPKFRIYGAVSPFYHTSSWHSAELGTGTVSPSQHPGQILPNLPASHKRLRGRGLADGSFEGDHFIAFDIPTKMHACSQSHLFSVTMARGRAGTLYLRSPVTLWIVN